MVGARRDIDALPGYGDEWRCYPPPLDEIGSAIAKGMSLFFPAAWLPEYSELGCTKPDCRMQRRVVGTPSEAESELLAHALHGIVLAQDLGRDAIEPFIAPNFDQPPQQLGADAAAVE
jgi:hypothetical protein